MIDYIEINIANNNYLIDVHKKIIQTNVKEKAISQEAIDNFLRIIRNWDKKYFDNKIIDGEKFKIIISYNGKKEIIEGLGGYPSNYHELKTFLVMYDD